MNPLKFCVKLGICAHVYFSGRGSIRNFHQIPKTGLLSKVLNNKKQCIFSCLLSNGETS